MTRQMVVAAMLAAAGLGAGVARAQDTFTVAVPPPDVTIARQGVFVGVAGGTPGGVAAPAGELLFVEPLEGGRPVTGAPYSAETVAESTQVLADGNRISHRSTATIARDSQGRERREHEGLFFGGVAAQRRQALVTITDPAAGTAITLDAERQVATRLRVRDRMMTVATRSATAGVRITAPVTAPLPPLPPLPPAGAAGFTMAFAPDAAGTMTWAPEAAGTTATDRLGTQTIEGVEAEGTRTTVTIPAGAIGNEAAIAIVSERWYSPDLRVVVLSRRHDPRFGETVFRLVNVVRAEPPADLFEIPAGYRVEEPALPERPRPVPERQN